MTIQILWRPIRTHLDLPAEPESISAEDRELHAGIVARHAALFPEAAPSAYQQYRVWHENIARLHAAIDSGRPTFVLSRAGDDTELVGAFNAALDDFDPAAPTVHLGTYLKNDPLLRQATASEFFPLDDSGFSYMVRPEQVVWPRDRYAADPNQYQHLAAIRRHAGRRMAAVTFEGGGEDDICTVAAEWARDCELIGLVKVMSITKRYFLTPYNLPKGADRDQALAALRLAFGNTIQPLEGVTGGLLLQDRSSMSHEYRIYVVDAKPVAGAGCIERMIPARDMSASPFDPRTQEVRNESPVTRNPDLVLRYVRAAGAIAREIVAECPTFKDYTLDLAVDDKDEVVVIETNSLLNFGIYAANYRHVLDACLDLVEPGSLA